MTNSHARPLTAYDRAITIPVAALLAALLPVIALAQTPAASGRSRWSVEFYGGGMVETQSKSGTPIAGFPDGEPFVTDADTPSRLHPSWRFGDGARLFNQVAGEFSLMEGRPFATIAPLDDVLRSPGARSGSRAIFGIRVGRELSPTLSVEVLIERNSGGLAPSDAAMAAINSADASFEAAFLDLLGTAPLTGLQVVSNVTRSGTSGTQTRLIGAVSKVLARRARWSVSGTAGAGVQLGGGDAAEVTLNGRYQFNLFNTAPIFERDEVVIAFKEPESALVGLLGLGTVYELSDVTGVRLGIRAHLAANRATTTITTKPHVNTGQTPGHLASVHNPSVQFSNVTTIPASLSPGLASTLTTFTGSGLNRQFTITLGLVRRF